MIEKMTPSESSQQDLDVTEKLEGSYSMPGSPNYVPSQDIKVHMMKESTDPASAGKRRVCTGNHHADGNRAGTGGKNSRSRTENTVCV